MELSYCISCTCTSLAILLSTVLAMTLASPFEFEVEKKAILGPDGDDSQLDWRSYHIAHACERTMLTMECDNDRRIHVVRASYGRQHGYYCMEGCSAGKGCETCRRSFSGLAQRRVTQMCNGEVFCEVPVVNFLFGDPCPNTYKYLEVYYGCV